MVSENFQKVFITGAAKGLGLALVSRFLRAGWLVFAAIYLPPKLVRPLSELDLRDGHLEATLDVNAFGSLQNDLKPKGFTVLVIHPGWMRTDMGGLEADIHPDESAEGIFGLSLKSWKAEHPMYMDYRGNTLPW